MTELRRSLRCYTQARALLRVRTQLGPANSSGARSFREDLLLTRRTTLKAILSAGVGLAFDRLGLSAHAEENNPLALRLAAGPPVELAEEFTGLGYEKSSVAPVGLLSEDNHEYVDLVRGLGEKGIIRIGGIVADYTRFDAQGAIRADPQNTVITEASLQQFAGFLDRVGWRTIWSLNFAQGTVDEAVTEARAVTGALGSHLFAFELGNEVENYGRGRHPFRPPSWDFDAYLMEYRRWHKAIREALPGARFAAPDTAGSVEWVENMARDAEGEVQLLTTHYYRADRSHGSADELLTPDPRLTNVLERLRTASQQSGIPWRMCETNSFSGGGLAGVSDTLIGALWTLDFMLLLAEQGCSGVNIETGVNQLGFLSYYSPVRNDSSGAASAGVSYYGMLAFAEARRGCTEMLPVDTDLSRTNMTAYVLGKAGKPRSLVIVNRDRSREAVASIRDLHMGDVTALLLSAPSAESTSHATLGGASVSAEGKWLAKKTEVVRNGVLRVPAMSAVVARSNKSA